MGAPPAQQTLTRGRNASILCHMKLADYLERESMSCGELARRLGMPTSTIWRIREGQSEPRASTALAIIRATKRRVKLEDLVSEAV